MTDLEILQELELPLFVPRAPEETEQQPASCHFALVVFVAERSPEFSESHQNQLDKILAFLNFNKAEYTLVYSDQAFANTCDTFLSFGNPPAVTAKNIVVTHSVSAMLQNPACKREVLHAIRHLQKT